MIFMDFFKVQNLEIKVILLPSSFEILDTDYWDTVAESIEKVFVAVPRLISANVWTVQ